MHLPSNIAGQDFHDNLQKRAVGKEFAGLLWIMPGFLGLYATMFDRDYLFEPLTKTRGMIKVLRSGLEL